MGARTHRVGDSTNDLLAEEKDLNGGVSCERNFVNWRTKVNFDFQIRLKEIRLF